jgi:hypothetical protein
MQGKTRLHTTQPQEHKTDVVYTYLLVNNPDCSLSSSQCNIPGAVLDKKSLSSSQI